MISRSYRNIAQLPIEREVLIQWAVTHNTHLAVATAIHAIADHRRSAQTIWEAPTPAEWDHVHMAVAEYILAGDYPAEVGGCYGWGHKTIAVNEPLRSLPTFRESSPDSTELEHRYWKDEREQLWRDENIH